MSIQVVVELDESGCLRKLDSRGHAIGVRNDNVACAAVSVLVRTAARTIIAHGDFDLLGDASTAGLLRCELAGKRELPESTRRWLRGVTEFLVTGLQDTARDYPDDVRLEINNETGG
ncbi:MAG TPA: ribosomal-processing cysteine protease Prp [Spirochaetia bacterium]|nr:ribosomal-processing cysteine protease Prp [Spirochaetia bacterium]